MALLLKTIWKNYDYVLNDLADERTKDWFLVTSPYPVLTLISVYLLVVYEVGPNFMRTRKAFDLEKLMIVYNGVQIAVCAYLVVKFTPYVWKMDPRCVLVDYSLSNEGLTLANLGYIYYLLKIADLLDTIFFVLRKKQRQVTFLHVYHHAGMVWLMWIGIRFVPGGQSTFIPYINSIVHTVMYGYYLLTVWNKEYKNSIWWKRYITQMQLVQFGMFTTLYAIPLLNLNCRYPKPLLVPLLMQVLIMFILFGEFYYKTYMKQSMKTGYEKEDVTIKRIKVSPASLSKTCL